MPDTTTAGVLLSSVVQYMGRTRSFCPIKSVVVDLGCSRGATS
jgi:hypothetical protein